jgi:hypothetical protein
MIKSSQKDVILYFRGQLGFDTISDLIRILKVKIRERHVSFVVYKKILMLMIESLENIIRYHEHLDGSSCIIINNPPEFQIYSENDQYIIESLNAIKNTDISNLDEKLKVLNDLNKQSIKDLYKTTITNGKFTEKGGAGLGIIEMAKITDEKLVFSFSPIDEHFSYFLLRMVVSSAVNDKKIDAE